MILLLLACGADPEPRGACPDGSEGRFTLLEARGLVSFDGRVWSGPPPGLREVRERFGDCELRELPLCEDCASDEVCRVDGCEPWPSTVDLGALRLRAAGRTRLEPIAPGFVYSTSPSLPTVGDPVQLVGEGLELTTRRVAPLQGTEGVWRLTDEPLSVGWEPSTGSDRVVLSLRIDQHGASQAELRCTFADEGEGRIPAEALDALRAVGTSGFPNGTLARQRVDHQALDGSCIELASVSEVSIEVEP